MLDHRIDKLIKKKCSPHDFPEASEYGDGTIAHCGVCGIQAKKQSSQRDGHVWVYFYPDRYITVKADH